MKPGGLRFWSLVFLLFSGLLSGSMFVFDRNLGSSIHADLTAPDLPPAFDWRDQGFSSPVLDQADCAASTAISAASLVESAIWLQAGQSIDLSENNAKECSWKELTETAGGVGCQNCQLQDLIVLFAGRGLVSDTCDPYTPVDATCNTACPTSHYLDGWLKLSGEWMPETADLKQALLTYGPIFTRIDSTLPGFASYDGSTILTGLTNSSNTDQAVLIVGWDDSAGGYWIAKNSYGSDWGAHGFFKVAYQAGGIGRQASVVTAWHARHLYEQTYAHDETGIHMGWTMESLTEYAMAVFTVNRSEELSQIIFWTNDAAEVDLSVYRRFENGSLEDLLYHRAGVSVPGPGMHAWPLDQIVRLWQGDSIAVVARIRNLNTSIPVVVSQYGEMQAGTSFISADGHSWVDLFSLESPKESTIRIRTTIPEPPPAPGSLQVVDFGTDQVTLQWNSSAQNILGFVIERRVADQSAWQQLPDQLSPDIRQFTDTGVAPDTTYDYRILAYNIGGLSSPSNTVRVTTLPLPPDAPLDLQAEAAAPNVVSLSWQDNSYNESGFFLQRSQDGGPWQDAADLPAGQTAYLDHSLLAETRYQYRLQSYNTGGTSPFVLSNIVQTPAWSFNAYLPAVFK